MYKHLDELRIFCIQHSPHIICLNETKFTEEFSNELLKTDGFQNIIRKDHTRHGRGVAVYVKMILNMVSESISIELIIRYVKPIIVTTIYKPKSKVEIYDKIESLIGKIDSEDKGVYIGIMIM